MTTDITELAQRMKAAAEKATLGQWITFDDDWSDDEDAVITNEARDDACTSPIAVIKGGGSESYESSPFYAEQRANAVFIALANPTNVKQLVEALEKAQQRIDELENDEVRQRLANAEYQLYMAELAKHNLKVSRKAQFRKRRAAKKRIAELESHTVKLTDINEFLADVHDKTLALAFRRLAEGVREADIAALTAQGIKCEAE